MQLATTILAFLLGWQASVYGAAQGLPFLGPGVVAVLLIVNAFTWTNPLPQLRVVCTFGIAGTLVESLMIRAGIYVPAESFRSQFLCPLWITAIWVQAGLSASMLARWTGNRLLVAALLGAGGAAIGYPLAAWLGAIRPLVSPLVAIPIWTLSTAALVPILLKFSTKQSGKVTKP
jgi:hypothetical protein